MAGSRTPIMLAKSGSIAPSTKARSLVRQVATAAWPR
jgi:hypothetical protein